LLFAVPPEFFEKSPELFSRAAGAGSQASWQDIGMQSPRIL
jgi:hypothetical protein